MKKVSGPVERYPTVDKLLEWLKAPIPFDRSRAAHMLGNYYAPRVVESLIEALDDPGPGVRSAVANSLGRLSRKQAMPSIARRAAERLMPLLKDKDIQVVASAVEALGQLGDSSVGPRLLPFLDYPNTPDLKMCNVTIGALCALRYQPAIPHFRRLTHHSDPSVRSDAMLALSSLRREFDFDLKEILESFLDDPEPLLRQHAKTILKIIAEEQPTE